MKKTIKAGWWVIPYFALAGLWSMSASAEDEINVRINNVFVNADGGVIIDFDRGTGWKPGCASQNNRYGFKANTTAGQAILATALSARLAGKPVDSAGMGYCDVFGDVETLRYITIRAG